MRRLAWLGTFACVLSSSASAQSVYRCGSEYAHLACADARTLDVFDPVSAERRAEALAAVDRERRLGESMAAAFRPPMAANIGPRVPSPAGRATPVAAKKKSRSKDNARTSDHVFDAETDFVARVPRPKKNAG